VFAAGQLIAALLVRRQTHAQPDVTVTARSRVRLSDATDAIGELRAYPSGLLMIGYVGAAFLLVGMADVLAVVLAFEILDLGPSGPGLLISAMGFGGIAGAAASIMLAGRRRLGPALTGSLLLAGAPFALAGLSTQLLAVVLLLAAAGAGKSLLDVATRTLLQRSVDEDVLARAFGVQEGLMMLALAIGSLSVPLLVALFGQRGAFVAAGLMLPMIGALTWARLRSVDAAAQPPPLSLALLRRVPMFGHLPAPVLERMASRMVPVEFAAGDTVIRQGDGGEHFYVVESGRLEVTVDGQPRPPLGPGDSFGEIAMMRDVPRTASIFAATASRLWALDRGTFLAAITGSRRVEAAVARVADTRLSATRDTGTDVPGYRRRRR
jgi:MFS family permease